MKDLFLRHIGYWANLDIVNVGSTHGLIKGVFEEYVELQQDRQYPDRSAYIPFRQISRVTFKFMRKSQSLAVETLRTSPNRGESTTAITLTKAEQLEMLLSNPDRWNGWRRDSRETADISSADLTRSKLDGVNFNFANLSFANLNGASCIGSSFIGADLSGADLRGARLGYSVLIGTKLRGALIDKTTLLSGTVFGDVDLAATKDLDQVKHLCPSTIGVDTLEKTAAAIGTDHVHTNALESFFRNAGVPQEYIELFRSRIHGPRRDSCFISYATQDQAFVDSLYAELGKGNVRRFLAGNDVKVDFRIKVDYALQPHDKLILVLSRDSIASEWIEEEVQQVLKREEVQREIVLFLVCLDDAVLESSAAWLTEVRKRRPIFAFQNWKQGPEYESALAQLLQFIQAAKCFTDFVK